MADLETCSWCTTEVPDSTLSEQPDGARICYACQRDVFIADLTRRQHEVTR